MNLFSNHQAPRIDLCSLLQHLVGLQIFLAITHFLLSLDKSSLILLNIAQLVSNVHRIFSLASVRLYHMLWPNDPIYRYSLMPPPLTYCLNCRSLYSFVAGALSMHAMKAAFQESNLVLSPLNTGIETRFICFHKS